MKKCTIVWLGFAVPDKVAQHLFSIDPLPAIQTHKFGWSFIRALLSSFDHITVVSSCPVQNYPLVNRLFFGGREFSYLGNSGYLLGFVNLMFLKHITRLFACLVIALPLIIRKRADWLFIHGLHTPYLLFGLLARHFGCRMAVVLTDPPGVVLSTDGWLSRRMKTVDVYLVKKMLTYADAIVALSPELVRVLAPKKPSLVFPGILESTFLSNLDQAEVDSYESDAPFTVVYAGGLSSSYGVDTLVDAILSIPDDINVILKIYGRGDQEYLIRRASEVSGRIVYGGFIAPHELLPELLSADLLINPRPPHTDISSQSFPSKLIEYLSTGRPVLTTRLTSIPRDLCDKFYYINQYSIDGIKSAILDVMKVPKSDRIAHGLRSRLFVQGKYSESMVGQMIYDFISRLDDHNFRI